MLFYRDLLDILIPRAERLGLVDTETGKADAVELQMYLFNALLTVVELHDLDTYLVRNTNIARTQADHEHYPVPEDFGRLVQATPLLQRGLRIDDTTDLFPLEYLDPAEFDARRSVRSQRPTHFTVQRRQIHLYPTPDSNSGNNYTVRGVYVERVSRPELDHEVLLDYPTALIEEALFTQANDMGKVTQALATRRTEALSRLVGGDMGDATRIGERFVTPQGR